MNKYYRLLIEDLKTMSSKENIWYWIFPYLLFFVLIALYFSGIPFLAEFVSPESNREYGSLENIQLIFILGVIIISFYGVFKKPDMLQKLGFGVLGLLAIFIFLEEMDYGDHFIRYFTEGRQRSAFFETFGTNSVHNQEGDILVYLRRAPYVIIFILFTILPFAKKKYFHPLFNYIIPKPRMALMIILFIVAYIVPRWLVDFNIFKVGSLGVGDSIGEFTELIVYYIFLIYVFHIVYDKEWPKYSTFKIVEWLRIKNHT